MRAPFQILVIPFRRTSTGYEFAVLKRSDAQYWQFVVGGCEDDESPIQAAERETKEEIGVAAVGRLLLLDSMSTVPNNHFAGADTWGSEVYVIPEYCFAADTGECAITLSREHTKMRWASYEQACSFLQWDSNRNALWELNERLRAKDSEPGSSVDSQGSADLEGRALKTD